MEQVRGGGGGAGGRGGALRIGVLEPKLVGVGYEIGIALGKGLFEPCEPNREAYVFGAELNEVDADNWNCYPGITGPTEAFDISSLTPNHEIAVALSVITNIYFERTIRHQWYRTRDHALLVEYSRVIPDPAHYGFEYWDWYYVYSYVGYVPWEINENGDYYWEMAIDSKTRRTDFTISGIPEVPEESEFRNFALSEFSKV